MRYIELNCDRQAHWALISVLRYIDVTNQYDIIEHVLEAQDYSGCDFVAALETSLLSSADGVQVVARALYAIPGREDLLLTSPPDWRHFAGMESIHQLLLILPDRNQRFHSLETEANVRKLYLIQNLHKAILGPTAAWSPGEVEDILSEYSLPQLESIALNFNRPYVKDVLLLGKKVFHVHRLLLNNDVEAEMTPRFIQNHLALTLRETGWNDQFPRIAHFLAHFSRNEDVGLKWETFANCLHMLDKPLSWLQGWEQLEMLMLAHGLIDATWDEHLLALLMVISAQRGHYGPSAKLIEAFQEKAYSRCQMRQLLGAWKRVSTANMLSIYIQPQLFDPLVINKVLEMDPARAKALFQVNFCQAINQLPLGEVLQRLLCHRVTQSSRTLDDLLQQLYQHMGRPIDPAAGHEEVALIEEAIVKGRQSRWAMASLRAMLTDELAMVNGYIEYADIDTFEISTIAEYREALKRSSQ